MCAEWLLQLCACNAQKTQGRDGRADGGHCPLRVWWVQAPNLNRLDDKWGVAGRVLQTARAWGKKVGGEVGG